MPLPAIRQAPVIPALKRIVVIARLQLLIHSSRSDAFRAGPESRLTNSSFPGGFAVTQPSQIRNLFAAVPNFVSLVPVASAYLRALTAYRDMPVPCADHLSQETIRTDNCAKDWKRYSPAT